MIILINEIIELRHLNHLSKNLNNCKVQLIMTFIQKDFS
jgi:hypothetical protein